MDGRKGKLRNKAQNVEKVEGAEYTPFGVEAGWQTGKRTYKANFRIVRLPDFRVTFELLW